MSGKKIKVALVITRMDLGGAQEVALEIVRRLDPKKFEPMLYSGKGGQLGTHARQLLGENYKELASLKHAISPFWDLWSILVLTFYFFRNGAEVVHTHSSKAGIVGRAAAWLAGVPAVVHTVHGWSFNDFMSSKTRALFIAFEKFFALITDRFIVVADSLAKQGLLEGIGDQGSYRTIRAASNLDAWRLKASKTKLLKRLGLKGNPPMVGSVANAKAQKCPEDFVKVAAQVLKKMPLAHFVYIGDGPRRQAAQSLAAVLNISSHVHFVGWSKNPENLARGFDLFLLTSLWEGLPCVFAQAMVLGLPVVATDVGGAAEIVLEGKTGYLCQPHDTAALADRVSVLLKKSVLRKQLGITAKKSVSGEYNFSTMAARHSQLYLDLLSQA